MGCGAFGVPPPASETFVDASVDIVRFVDLPSARMPAARREIEEIFFEASLKRKFASVVARAAFRWRWLEQYLAREPELSFVAVDGRGVVRGYLVGSLSDPASLAAFGDLPYVRDLAPLTRMSPAHLHINVAAALRGQGVGSRLIEAFTGEARAAGARAIHVMTGAGMRNVGFYAREGFVERGRAASGGSEVVLLVRDLRDCTDGR